MLWEWHDAHPPLAAAPTAIVSSKATLRCAAGLTSTGANAGNTGGAAGVLTPPARFSVSMTPVAPIFSAQSSAVSPARLLMFGSAPFAISARMTSAF